MKHWISLSGGIGSGVSALVARRYRHDFELIFADTLIEDEDAYRFNHDIARRCGKEIITVTTGKTPWDSYLDHRYIGNTRTAHCSEDLKFDPIKRFLDRFAAPGDPVVLGMDWSEMDRIERAQARWGERPVVSLLNDHKVTRPQHRGYLVLAGIRPPRLYDYGFPHNNCGGFCCKAGLAQFRTLLEAFPERFDRHEREMESTMAKIGPTARPFLRHKRNGTTEYLTLRQFRERVEAGTITIDPFDYGACGCFTEGPTA